MRVIAIRMKNPWKPGPTPLANRPVLVVTTRLTWKRFHYLPEVIVAGLRFRQIWGQLEGALGVQTGSEPLRRTMVSISVWENEAAFQSFMRHPRHRKLMNRHRARLSGSRSARWWTEHFDLHAAWKEGDRLLAEDDPMP